MLTVPAMDTVRVGFVGVGMRGSSAVERYTYIPGVKINALCDVEADRVEAAQKTLEDRGLPKAAGYSGSTEAYKELCERDDIDLVYICTDWKHHVPISLYAMEHGKNVAVEVPAAFDASAQATSRATADTSRRRGLWLAAAGVVLLAALGAAYYLHLANQSTAAVIQPAAVAATTGPAPKVPPLIGACCGTGWKVDPLFNGWLRSSV